MNTNTAQTIHYDMTGNAYYMRASSGFCGSTAGRFTFAKDEITCADCLEVLAANRAWCNA